jgi:acyl carrier protein
MTQEADMDDSEIYARLAPVFQDVFDDETIIPHADMVADDVEEWDSLSHIRLILALEQTFDVRFTAVEVGSMSKVGDLVRLIQAKKAG